MNSDEFREEIIGINDFLKKTNFDVDKAVDMYNKLDTKYNIIKNGGHCICLTNMKIDYVVKICLKTALKECSPNKFVENINKSCNNGVTFLPIENFLHENELYYSFIQKKVTFCENHLYNYKLLYHIMKIIVEMFINNHIVSDIGIQNFGYLGNKLYLFDYNDICKDEHLLIRCHLLNVFNKIIGNKEIEEKYIKYIENNPNIIKNENLRNLFLNLTYNNREKYIKYAILLKDEVKQLYKKHKKHKKQCEKVIKQYYIYIKKINLIYNKIFFIKSFRIYLNFQKLITNI